LSREEVLVRKSGGFCFCFFVFFLVFFWLLLGGGKMSGATLAAGRWGSKRHGEGGYDERNSRSGAGGLGGMMGSLRVIELQLVAFIVVFSASGLVPVADLLFPIFITLYAFLLSAAIFPSYKGGDLQVFKGNRLFQGYVIVGTSVGLFLPLAFVLGGFARGNQQAVRSATPHLFLLSCQILTENLVNGLQIFSLPVRVLLPILYSARRIFSLSDWVQSTFTLSTLPQDPTFEVGFSLPPKYVLFLRPLSLTSKKTDNLTSNFSFQCECPLSLTSKQTDNLTSDFSFQCGCQSA